PALFRFEAVAVADEQKEPDDNQREWFSFLAALHELSEDPSGEGDDNQEKPKPKDVLIMEGGEREQPDRGGEHGKAHQHLEPFHPGTRLGQKLEPARLETQQDV